MRKRCIVILITIALLISIIFCCYISINCYTSIRTLFDNKRLKTEEEIIEIFKQNKEIFTYASDDLLGHQYHWSLSEEQYNDEIRPDWNTVLLNNKMQITIKEQSYFNEISSMQEIVENNKSIEEIIKKLKFKIITSNSRVDKGCVYFIKQTLIGFDSGIINCPDGKPENPYITKLTEIEDSWFYYESK